MVADEIPALGTLPTVFLDGIVPLPLVDQRTAADFLKVAPHTLACYRNTGKGPAYYKFGQYVRYSWSDLKTWSGMAERRGSEEWPSVDDRYISLVDARLAARFLTLTEFWFRRNRSLDQGPPFIRYGRRAYYRLDALSCWAAARRITAGGHDRRRLS